MTRALLKDLKSTDDIARICGIEKDFIEAYSASSDQRAFYRELRLSKKGRKRQGQHRVVFAAFEHRLSALHRSIAMIVSNSCRFGGHVQGFLRGRSIRTNAQQHLGAMIILHADISSFFDSITVNQVRVALIGGGAPVDTAGTIASLSTIDGALRQGTRCSPVIANLVCAGLDDACLRLAEAHGAVYTRYADDLTFSGNQVPDDAAVREILSNQGFNLRDDRCYRQRRGKSQYVTGLTVTDRERPRLPRLLKRRLRLEMYFIEKHGLEGHAERIANGALSIYGAYLEGMLRFARPIEPELVDRWQIVLEEAKNSLRVKKTD